MALAAAIPVMGIMPMVMATLMKQAPGAKVPNPGSAVEAACCNQVAVGAKGDGLNIFVMP